jgi:hypothetical protein
MPPCTRLFLDQREFRLDLGGIDQPRAGSESFRGADLALDLVHAAVVADTRDLEAPDLGVAAAFLEEIDGVKRCPARQEIVTGRIAEVRGVTGRTDVGRDRRLVDADDVVPAALDQVVGDGCADDAAKTDDDDLRLFRKFCHCPRLRMLLRADYRAARQRARSLFATSANCRATTAVKSRLTGR